MDKYIFELLDYADVLVAQIKQGATDKRFYFLSLVYIEDMIDTYGRGLVYESAAGQTLGLERKDQVNQRLEQLRAAIAEFKNDPTFASTLDEASRRLTSY